MACGKEFLEKKPNKAQVVPESIGDLQALLDSYGFIDLLASGELASIAADDFFSFEPDLAVYVIPVKNTYFWEKDMYGGYPTLRGWNSPYQAIFYANVVLEGLSRLSPAPHEQAAYDHAKAMALYYRGYAMYILLQGFSAPYTAATAASMPGVPIRSGADVNEVAARSSQEACYQYLINQLEAAIPLLPDHVTTTWRPRKVSAYSMLVRTYLAMENYERAEYYADLSLAAASELLDFNTLNENLARPFPMGDMGVNPEVLQFEHAAEFGYASNAWVDSALYNLYQPNDRRKVCYFNARNGYYIFKGSYSGGSSAMAGPCTDEMYLAKAECLARRNSVQPAMDTLNALLRKRYVTNTLVPLTAATGDEALGIILVERRKELVGRAIRWHDLRRLNKDSRFATTLRRIRSNGSIVELPPGNPRYTFPIPEQEVEKSGIEQNPR